MSPDFRNELGHEPTEELRANRVRRRESARRHPAEMPLWTCQHDLHPAARGFDCGCNTARSRSVHEHIARGPGCFGLSSSGGDGK